MSDCKLFCLKNYVLVDDAPGSRPTKKVKTSITAPKDVLDEIRQSGDHDEPMQKKTQTLAERESDYQKRRYKVLLSPERIDPFKE